MPRNIVDLSARSAIIRDEPWHLHFWESTAQEARDYLLNPREHLGRLGIELPADCRIETVIENHDWMTERTGGLSADNGPIIICNIGGGNVARAYYRVSMYAHTAQDVGRFEKALLHTVDEEAIERR